MAELYQGIFRNRRVLVTGHTGFKGAWLCLWLSELGAKVTGYALRPPTHPNLFETARVRDGISSVLGDVRNLRALSNVFKKTRPEIVFHLAAQSLVRNSYGNPVETYGTNVMGTLHVLEACRRQPSVRAIVAVTSDKCYENKNLTRGYKETDPMGGHDPYSSSKGCAELLTHSYLRSFFLDGGAGQSWQALASARAGNVIGGGDWAADRLLPDCVRALSKKQTLVIRYPDAVRPWQHVLEPLHGYLMLAERLFTRGNEFGGGWNFGPGPGSAKAVKHIVERVTALWGSPKTAYRLERRRVPHEAGYLKLDCAKAKARLGWRPHWDLETSLKKTVEWYKHFYSRKDVRDLTLRQIREYSAGLGRKGAV